MMTGIRVAAMALATMLVVGCTQTAVVGRFARAECEDQTGRRNACSAPLSARATAILAPRPNAAAAARDPFALPERALASYISAITAPRFSPDSAALRANLTVDLSEPAPAAPLFRDATAVRGVLIISIVSGSSFNPADRIEQAEITLGLSDHSRFVAWDAARTPQAEIRPGSVEGQRTVNLALTAEAAPPALPFGLSGTASVENRRTERFEPVLYVQDIGVTIDEANRLLVSRAGGLGRDLRGNATVDVTIQPGDGLSASAALFRASGLALRDTGTARLERRLISRLTRPMTADLTMEYWVRHIVSGAETYEDRDDVVRFIRRESRALVTLANPQPLWGLIVGSDVEEFLVAEGASSRAERLCVGTRGEAEVLREYFQRQPGVSRLGDFRLLIEGAPNRRVQPRDLSNLQVNQTCAPISFVATAPRAS